MSGEVVHRKLNKYEWIENTAAKGTTLQPSGIIKEVLGSALASSEKKVYMCGGYDPRTGSSLSQVAEFDLTTKQWSKGIPLPEKIRNASAVAIGDYCIVFGGWNDESYSRNLWLLAPKNQEIAGAAGTTGASSSSNNNNNNNNNSTSNNNNKDPVSFSWTLVRPTGPSPSARVCHSMVLGGVSSEEEASHTPVVYLFGGFNGERRLNDVWRLKLTPLLERGEAAWEAVEAHGGTPPTPRDDAAVAFDAAGERLLVFGGFAASLQSDLHFLTLRGGRHVWAAQPCLHTPSRRQGCIAAVSGGHLVVCLGENEKEPLPQILQLSMTDFKWSLLSVEKEDLLGRKGAVGCVSEKGKRIIVFGGGAPPRVGSSLLELELEKADTGSSRKK